MIDKLQSLKGKTSLIFCETVIEYYDERKFMKQRVILNLKKITLPKDAGRKAKILLKVLLLVKFSQTKPQIKKHEKKL